jgi:hypothetical protein
MHMRNTLLLFATGLLLAGSAAAQQKDQYLDILVVKVKPERRADFDALNKRFVEANRTNGDIWLALSTEYGENNTVTFISPRTGYAGIDQGYEAFMGAVNKAFGPAEGKKAMQDFDSMIVSSRGELRKRRPDLSMNFPSDPAEWAKFIGESRWVRISTVHVRPGRSADYEAEIKRIKDAWEKSSQKVTIAVSQGMEGTSGPVYYIAAYGKSLGSFDGFPSLREVLGEEAFQRYLKATSELVAGSQSELLRYLPELSNPPKEVVAAAPDFWNPKPAEMATAQ